MSGPPDIGTGIMGRSVTPQSSVVVKTASKWPSGNRRIEEMAAINIARADFHGEWNYTIQPSNRSNTAVNP
jgi:hypothetical protein